MMTVRGRAFHVHLYAHVASAYAVSPSGRQHWTKEVGTATWNARSRPTSAPSISTKTSCLRLWAMRRWRAMSSRRAKDGLVEWLGRENLSKGVQIRSVGDMLDVDLFIIVEYGISIAEVCKTIVETVRYKLESMTGVKVRKVNISVEGIRV